jgi:hypothetical protein
LDYEESETSDWKYWSWETKGEEEEINMGESSEGDKESLGEDMEEFHIKEEKEHNAEGG